jgi:NADPH-dependent curcumin reductase CurA
LQVQLLKEFGYDEAYNYKKMKPMDALNKLCPNGIDI